MSPEQMLEHVYAIRSDIIDALEDHELHARQETFSSSRAQQAQKSKREENKERK